MLIEAVTSKDKALAKRAFNAMMPMKKIDIATLEAAIKKGTEGIKSFLPIPGASMQNAT
jgi:2-polyprenyl-6-hydroxyphenyl methylase/3-demethylubiquinone-9 3-methyltransferase